jgi:hypothetical protein
MPTLRAPHDQSPGAILSHPHTRVGRPPASRPRRVAGRSHPHRTATAQRPSSASTRANCGPDEHVRAARLVDDADQDSEIRSRPPPVNQRNAARYLNKQRSNRASAVSTRSPIAMGAATVAGSRSPVHAHSATDLADDTGRTTVPKACDRCTRVATKAGDRPRPLDRAARRDRGPPQPARHWVDVGPPSRIIPSTTATKRWRDAPPSRQLLMWASRQRGSERTGNNAIAPRPSSSSSVSRKIASPTGTSRHAAIRLPTSEGGEARRLSMQPASRPVRPAGLPVTDRRAGA